MNKAVKAIALMAFITLSVMAARSFNNPSDAAMNCPEIQNYMRQGFSLDNVTPNAYRYITAPTGTYDWGTVTVQLHGKTGGPYSLETTYATVTCYIQAKEQGGTVKYSTTSSNTYETVVY